MSNTLLFLSNSHIIESVSQYNSRPLFFKICLKPLYNLILALDVIEDAIVMLEILFSFLLYAI